MSIIFNEEHTKVIHFLLVGVNFDKIYYIYLPLIYLIGDGKTKTIKGEIIILIYALRRGNPTNHPYVYMCKVNSVNGPHWKDKESHI